MPNNDSEKSTRQKLTDDKWVEKISQAKVRVRVRGHPWSPDNDSKRLTNWQTEGQRDSRADGLGENKPNGWIAILAALAFRYFSISSSRGSNSNNRNQSEPQILPEFFLSSCGNSHPLAHKFLFQLFCCCCYFDSVARLSRDLFCFRALVYCVFASRIK